MKHIGETIDKIIREKRLIRKDVASRAGITAAYLSNVIHKDEISTGLLGRLCEALGVSPEVFFDLPKSAPLVGELKNTAIMGNANVHVSQGEVEALHKVIESQEQTIAILMHQLGMTPGQKRDK